MLSVVIGALVDIGLLVIEGAKSLGSWVWGLVMIGSRTRFLEVEVKRIAKVVANLGCIRDDQGCIGVRSSTGLSQVRETLKQLVTKEDFSKLTALVKKFLEKGASDG